MNLIELIQRYKLNIDIVNIYLSNIIGRELTPMCNIELFLPSDVTAKTLIDGTLLHRAIYKHLIDKLGYKDKYYIEAIKVQNGILEMEVT